MRILFLSFSLLLLVAPSSFGQWIYPNEEGVDVADMWFKVPNTAEAQEVIAGHPCLTDIESAEPANIFFGIKNNGELWLGEVPASEASYVLTASDSEMHTQYDFNETDFLFLKLINKYEDEEDPYALVANGPTGPTTSSPVPVQGLTLSSGQGFLVSNDLVDQKDVVLTIFPSFFDPVTSQYLLCHDGLDVVNFEPFDFPLPHGPILNGISAQGGGVFFDQGNVGQERCMRFSVVDRTKPVFVRQRVYIDPGVLDNLSQTNPKIVDFSIHACKGSGESTSCDVFYPEGDVDMSVCLAGLYNDPNFTRLECVWIDQDSNKFARYHVECFNDGQSGFDSLTMSVVLPDGAIPSTVVVDRTMSMCNLRCDDKTNNDDYVSGLVTTRERLDSNQTDTVQLSFDRGLCGYNHDDVVQGCEDTCRFTAWFEFTVQFTSDTDLAFGDLQPSAPCTNFNTTPYDIHPYYDDKVCYSSGMLDTLAQREPDSLLRVNYQSLTRPMVDFCNLGRIVEMEDCGTDCQDSVRSVLCPRPIWPWVLAGLGLFAVSWLLFRKRL